MKYSEKEDNYMWVPVEMSLFTLKNKFYKPFRLYLYLAFTTSGMVSFDKSDREKTANYLGCSERTLFRQIKPLLQRNWIGKNHDTGTHFIRGFEAIRRIEGFHLTVAAKMYPETLLNIKSLKGFCTAAIIGNRILKKQREEERLNKNSDVHSRTLDLPPNSMQVAANYLKHILDLSKATCHRLKQDAEKYGYIKITQNISLIELRDMAWIHSMQKYDTTGNRFYRNSKWEGYSEHIQPDIITTNMQYRYRRKIK